MPKAKSNSSAEALLREVILLQQNQLIVQLAVAGLTQHQIRETVGCDMHRVVRIVKHLKKAKG
jgi:hypothetical protein